MATPRNEGIVAQSWVYFLRSEGWTPRNEALMEAEVKHVRSTRRPWLVARDEVMNLEDFKKSLWCKSRHLIIGAPGEGVSACRSKGLNGEFFQRTYDYVIASHSFQGNIKNMEVVEDSESRPHKRVTVSVEIYKEFKKCAS